MHTLLSTLLIFLSLSLTAVAQEETFQEPTDSRMETQEIQSPGSLPPSSPEPEPSPALSPNIPAQPMTSDDSAAAPTDPPPATDPNPSFSDSPSFEKSSSEPNQAEQPQVPLPPAITAADEWQTNDWRFGALAATSLPTFTGLGFTLQNPHVEISIGWGVMPKYYSNFLAKTVADLSDNPGLEPVIKDVLMDNRVIRGGINYRFQKGPGWQVGISAVKIDSSGSTPIDDALNAALKQDFSPIVDILEQLGVNIQIAHETTLFGAEFYGGYSWLINDNFYIDFSLGLLRVLKTEFEISTGLGDLEETAPIKQIIDGAEKDLERTVTDNGYAPVLALRFAYLF